jgi:hypothetical protein
MRLLATMILGLLLISGAVRAAGPYDGNWSGAVQGTGSHCMSGTVTMQISNNAISGVVGLAAGSIRIQGNVAADGSVNATYNNPSNGGESTLTGTISGGDFAGRLESRFPSIGIACVRHVTAKRS